MITKNISVKIKKEQASPFEETYLAIQKSKDMVKIYHKEKNELNNQKIELNFKECERLINILFHFVFKGNYKYSKDSVIIYHE
ncbi:MAG: hypothetical protein P8Y23_06595 [Candidatus Lokiarchaeota archaeon]|jgi:hypothetical protein